MARRDLRLVGVNCEVDLYDALEEFAARESLNLSEAGRLLLRKALQGEGAELVSADLSDVGYLAGFRKGLRDVHEHMAKLKPHKEGSR